MAALVHSQDYDDMYSSQVAVLKLKALDNLFKGEVKETLLTDSKSKFLDSINQFLLKMSRNSKRRQVEVQGFSTEFLTLLRMTPENQRWEVTRNKAIEWPILTHALWDAVFAELRMRTKNNNKRNAAHITLEKLEPFLPNNAITRNLWSRNREEVRKINKGIEAESMKTDLEISLHELNKKKLLEFSNKNKVKLDHDDYEVSEYIRNILWPLDQQIEKLNSDNIVQNKTIDELEHEILKYKEDNEKFSNEQKKLDKLENRIVSRMTGVVQPDLTKVQSKLDILETNYISMSMTLKAAVHREPGSVPGINVSDVSLSQASSAHYKFPHVPHCSSFLSQAPDSHNHYPVENSFSSSTNSRGRPSPVEQSYSSISATSSNISAAERNTRHVDHLTPPNSDWYNSGSSQNQISSDYPSTLVSQQYSSSQTHCEQNLESRPQSHEMHRSSSSPSQLYRRQDTKLSQQSSEEIQEKDQM